MQKKADTHPDLLRQVSQFEQNHRSSGQLKFVACPPELERKFREISQNRVGTTYEFSTIAVEYGVVDLHIGTTLGINSAALEVACPPPGIGAEKSGKFLRTASEVLTSPAVLLSNVLS